MNANTKQRLLLGSLALNGWLVYRMWFTTPDTQAHDVMAFALANAHPPSPETVLLDAPVPDPTPHHNQAVETWFDPQGRLVVQWTTQAPFFQPGIQARSTGLWGPVPEVTPHWAGYSLTHNPQAGVGQAVLLNTPNERFEANIEWPAGTLWVVCTHKEAQAKQPCREVYFNEQ